MNRSVSRHWERARAYLKQRQLTEARTQLESMRAMAPGDVRTRLLAAQIAWHADHLRDAAAHALDAMRVVHDDTELLCATIDTLLQVGESAAAHGLLDRPAWQTVAPGSTLLHYAAFRQRFGEHTQSLAALDRLIRWNPGDGEFRFDRGQQLAFLGQLEPAAAEFEACLMRAPTHGAAAYHLVRLQRQTLADNCLDVIDAGLQRARSGSRNHAAFEFARYHVLEDLGRTEEAWQSLARANATMHALCKDDAARQQTGHQRFLDCLQSYPLRVGDTSYDGPCPIFILGLPRSGTTVLERMLANHAQVQAAGELVDFGQQLLWVADTRTPFGNTFQSRLGTLDVSELGRRYRLQTVWRANGKSYYVDKQPTNWMTAGLIHAALPQAKILHLVRDPMDVCFGDYRARFGDACAWSYDFATLAAYYGQYRRMMRYWHTACPGAILDVDYAELVRDPSATLRRVFDFCGFGWEAGCEDITRNAAPVSTLSSAQVREPVHTRALEHWRRYPAQLEPLRRMLSLA